jgi:formamidopyrimidine-DNA glycosylase
MPELPDVELVRRRLEHALKGATITAARSTDPYVLRPQSPASFSRALAGRTVREIGRRGKWIRIALDDGGRLFSHFGMTGWWVERDPKDPKERSERARLDVTRSGRRPSTVRYTDSRRFGRLRVARDDIPEWTDLGPDPLADGIDTKRLADAFARSRRSIKESLMDQALLAGVGNILATEGLYYARIDPRSRSDALSRADVTKVARGLKTAIQRQLDVRLAAEGDEWEETFAVYGRAGQPCPRCGTGIEEVVLGGRTTTFCPHCQVRRGA